MLLHIFIKIYKQTNDPNDDVRVTWATSEVNFNATLWMDLRGNEDLRFSLKKVWNIFVL